MSKIREKDPELIWKKREKVLAKEGESVLTYRLETPILRGNGKGSRQINRFYERTEQVWEQRWTGRCRVLAEEEQNRCQQEGRPFVPWHGELTGEVTWMDGERLCVRMEAREQRESRRSSQVCWGDIWNLKDGSPCSAEQVLNRKKKEILEEIIRQGRERLRTGICFLDSDWEQKVRKLLGTLSPCLTEEGVEYDFPQATIAPAAEGIVRFTVGNGQNDKVE